MSKTTLSVNTAGCLAAVRGDRVAIIDSDSPNFHSHLWGKNRAELPPDQYPTISIEKQTGRQVGTSGAEKSRDYDDVIFDCAGRTGPELQSAIVNSDVFVIPVGPSLNDIDTIYEVDQIVADARVANPNVMVYVMLTKVPANPQRQDFKEAWDYLVDALGTGEFEEIDGLLETHTRDRVAWPRTLNFGIALPEFQIRDSEGNLYDKDLKAVEKLQGLINELEAIHHGN